MVSFISLAKAAYEKTSYQSTVLNDDSMWAASKAVDSDTRSNVLDGSCSQTQSGKNPWLVVDLGNVVDVYAVQLKSLQPLSMEN